MVDAGSAVGENTASVCAPVAGVNSHRNRAVANLALKTTASIVARKAANLVLSALSFASLIFSNIRIGALRGDAVSLDIAQCAMRPSSAAALVSLRSGAVNQLLFRNIDALSFKQPP